MKRSEVTISTPSETDLAYLAGILDGEGCFAVQAKKGGFGIAVCMADTAVLDWIAGRFSGSLSGLQRGYAPGRPRKMWWLSRRADLAYLLPRVIPYLVLKRREAEAMLDLAHHAIARMSQSREPNPAWTGRRDALIKQVLAARDARKFS